MKILVTINACPMGTSVAVTKEFLVEAKTFHEAEMAALEGYHLMSWTTSERRCERCGGKCHEGRWTEPRCTACRKAEDDCKCPAWSPTC